jgi:tetratricopeptide (TPR) repeat protein
MRTRKRSIAGLMWLVLAAAVGLTLAREGPIARWPAWLWVVLFLGALAGACTLAGTWLWFILIPQMSLRLAGGDRDRQRRLLQLVVNTPSPGGVKILARFLLALNDQVAKRYDSAETQYRAILSANDGDLDAGFESTVRQRLADTLEALERFDEAAVERKRAGAALSDPEETVVGLQAKGKLLERDHRYGDAYAAYERALSLAPDKPKAVRTELMMHLALSSFNAGRPADTLRWAEAVIDCDPQSRLIGSARRMAAVACANLGRLTDAEQHGQVAAELATTAEQRARSLALLAGYLVRRGDLPRAEQLAREADALVPGKTRVPWAVIGEVEKARGHYEAAISALERAISIPEGFIPASNRRASAAIQKELALLHAELGRTDVALALLREAELELEGDPKLSVTLDAAAALVHALANDREAALARMASADEHRQDVLSDGTTQRATLYLLGRAALLVGEPACAETLLRASFELNPDPVHWPHLYYYLAGCRRMLGDAAGGDDFDTKAASTQFGTHWERLARERLAARGGGV